MVDLRTQYLRIKPEIDDAIQEVINATAYIQGSQVQTFSNELAEFLQAQSVVTCGNGTDALQIGMMALGLKPGDEVILPVFTYVATAEVIALLGLTPVFADVDEETFNIDVNKLEEKITSKTKAIVPVHLFGQCADMERILQLASRYNLYVIEDAAQALGAEEIFQGGIRMKAGTIGTIGTTSFFPSKNLGCFGDGGAMITNDLKLAGTLKTIANHGQKVKYHHESIGVNSRLDTLQAAILLVKLKYLKAYEQNRNDAADHYDRELKALSPVQIPIRSKNSTHVFHQYSLKAERRDELKMHLERKGIPSMIYYPIPLHLQKAYENQHYPKGSFPIAERLSNEVISLPMHTELKTEELDFICSSIKEFYHG
jgi:UDP-2-acetamido-2-deoxy-ribo-hexuluronate aminotransferase